MKTEQLGQILMVVSISCLLGVSGYVMVKTSRPEERSSSFVGYSQSCWQVGDTTHVVTANGDTVRLDTSKLK